MTIATTPKAHRSTITNGCCYCCYSQMRQDEYEEERKNGNTQEVQKSKRCGDEGTGRTRRPRRAAEGMGKAGPEVARGPREFSSARSVGGRGRKPGPRQ